MLFCIWKRVFLQVVKMHCSYALYSYSWFVWTVRAVLPPDLADRQTDISQDPFAVHPLVSPVGAVGLGHCWAEILCGVAALPAAGTDQAAFGLGTVLGLCVFLCLCSLNSSSPPSLSPRNHLWIFRFSLPTCAVSPSLSRASKAGERGVHQTLPPIASLYCI